MDRDSAPAMDYNQAIVPEGQCESHDLHKEAERARDFMGRAKSDNTLKAYAADWRHFEKWCAQRLAKSLPASPATVAVYLAACAGAVGQEGVPDRRNLKNLIYAPQNSRPSSAGPRRFLVYTKRQVWITRPRARRFRPCSPALRARSGRR